MMNTYKQAVAADDAFSQAIAKQFGKAATRWSVDPKLFNEETKAAYQAKLVSDLANLNSIRKQLSSQE